MDIWQCSGCGKLMVGNHCCGKDWYFNGDCFQHNCPETKEKCRVCAITDDPYASKKVTGQFVISTIKQLQAERDRLREFARHVIKVECWSIFEQDGGDIQELAEKLSLIEPHIATIDDIDDESDFDVGDTIYKFTKTLKENTDEI